MKIKSSIIELGGILLAVHFLSFILYAAVWSPALQIKYGVLSIWQFHLWLATISLPTVFLIAFFEKRFKRRLSPLVIKVIFGVWFIAMLYVFFLMPTERKVMLDPSKNNVEMGTK